MRGAANARTTQTNFMAGVAKSQGAPVCFCILTAKRTRSGTVRDPMPISMVVLSGTIPDVSQSA